MDLIYKVTDKDIGEKEIDMQNPRVRIAARGIVIRDDGKIAVFNKTNKNEYKLPGGGLEGNEPPEEAFFREVLEETGCKVEIIKSLGTIEEHKSLSNYKQISYVFVSKVKEDTSKLELTDKEKDEGAKLIWEYPQKALELISSCYDKITGSIYDDLYETKFIVLRDRKILEYFLREENII